MKNLFILVLAAILCSCSDSATLEKSLLWKISGNGLSKSSYLFGTLHSTCEVIIDDPLTNALNNTEQLYLEMDPDEPNAETEMEEGTDMKNGVTLKSLLSDADFEILNNYFLEHKGRSIYVCNTYKPEFINMMLTSKILDCPNKTKSYEEEIKRIIKQQNKEIFGFETMKEQIAIYDNIPYKVQAEGLVNTVKDNLANAKLKAKKMIDMYGNKDIEGLELAIRNSDNKTYSNYADIILSDRNKKWIPKFEQAAKAKPTFFAIGASHLAGKEGVIMLLRKKGYKVEAVK